MGTLFGRRSAPVAANETLGPEVLAAMQHASGRGAVRLSAGAAAARVLLHIGFLLLAVGCLAAYEHFHAEGQSTASWVSLGAAAVFGFTPLRDVLHLFFGVEGAVLHLVHALGALALVGVPVSGAVSGGPVLTHAAMAPFAMMGAAQAVMHQNHPRNAAQAAALQRFAASLPEVAQFTSGKNLTSPENARRAIAALTDIIAKAQALGQTELDGDPNFQSALARVSTRMGTNLGLDAVDVAIGQLAARPGGNAAALRLRKQLAQARGTLAAAQRKKPAA